MPNSKNIAFFHYKVGGTDGVSLEIEKWKRVLESLGQHVFLCAGELGQTDGFYIEAMYQHHPQIARLYRNSFNQLKDFDPQAYERELLYWSDRLEGKLIEFLVRYKIDLINVQNIWSVALNPPLAIALENVRRKLSLPALAHHHDFYWERTEGIAVTTARALEVVDTYLPPRTDGIEHIVINSLASQELSARKGIQAQVFPNVFDFNDPPWQVDAYNRDFREQISVAKNDVLILQATRIVPRKGIELAIDFVNALNQPERRKKLVLSGLFDGRKFSEENQIVLVLAGYAQDDRTGQYLDKLKHKIAESGIATRFIEERIAGQRCLVNGKKIYNLWDAYTAADFAVYPSLWEGWGNQLLEAVFARLPVLIFEYPVYLADIKQRGFQLISLGGQTLLPDEQGLARVSPDLIDAAADQAIELLSNQKLRADLVELNFRIGQKYFSFEVLRERISTWLAAG
jgi:glycosyltransferase involved in cell wall biosynthesis